MPSHFYQHLLFITTTLKKGIIVITDKLEVTDIRQDPLNEANIQMLSRMYEQATLPEEVAALVDADEQSVPEEKFSVYEMDEGFAEFKESIDIVKAMFNEQLLRSLQKEQRTAISKEARVLRIKQANAWTAFCDYIIHSFYPDQEFDEDLTRDEVELMLTRQVPRKTMENLDGWKLFEENGFSLVIEYAKFNVRECDRFNITPSVSLTIAIDGVEHEVNKQLSLSNEYNVAWFRITEEFVSSIVKIASEITVSEDDPSIEPNHL